MKDMHSDVAVFWEKFGTESLFSPDVVSQRCKECRKCSCTISKREVLSEIEAEFLEKNIRFDPIEKKMEVQYITEGHLSPDEFVDNQKSVLGFARKTNDKMSKLPVNDVEGYNDNLQKAIGMGAIQNYNDFEIKHPKIKSLKQRFVRGSYAYSGKASTKLRPIWDQSQTSPGEAIAPNSYWMRGGNVANLSRIFTFFRAGTYISTADIKKAFYGFNVSLQDAVLSKIYLPTSMGKCLLLSTGQRWASKLWTH